MSISDSKLRNDALVFYEEDIEAIDSILESFVNKSRVRSAILVDKDGHKIRSRGEPKDVDLDTISALVAGSFAATQTLARKLGETDFTALFHQGSTGNIQLSLVADRALLTAIFGDDTTIGMVRLFAGEAAKRLTEIFRRKTSARAAPPAGHGASAKAPGQPLAGPGFAEASGNRLNDVLGG